MSLDAVRTIFNDDSVSTEATKKTDAVFEKWEHFPLSKFSHHGAVCCETAREWLFAMDFSQLSGASVLTGPRWIRQKYNWGPTKWQIYWCEAIEQKSLDCGAQAALAHKVFSARGVRSYQVQLVQQYSRQTTDQWAKTWEGEYTSLYWIKDDLIYHEGCAVLVSEDEIKLWDASSGWWINPAQCDGYGGLRAVRLCVVPDDVSVFKWGKHRITANRWQKIENKREFSPDKAERAFS